MSERSCKACIAARDLQIRVADSRQRHPNQGFAKGVGPGDLAHRELLIFETQGFHFLLVVRVSGKESESPLGKSESTSWRSQRNIRSPQRQLWVQCDSSIQNPGGATYIN